MVIRLVTATIGALFRCAKPAMTAATVRPTTAAATSEPRCPLAPVESDQPCVGWQEAVTLGIWRGDKDLVKLSGCVLHAGMRLAANPPSKVYLTCPPPAKAGHALAALELARLISHWEADDLPADAHEMRVVYVGLPPW